MVLEDKSYKARGKLGSKAREETTLLQKGRKDTSKELHRRHRYPDREIWCHGKSPGLESGELVLVPPLKLTC